jgi:regulator of protease activity HflC (stomatin/prohibitin superfamily)
MGDTLDEKSEAKSPQHILHFVDQVVTNEKLLLLRPDESLTAGLRRLDSYLLSDFAGTTGMCSRYAILQGQIGFCTYYGRTHFLPPGHYFRIGLGCKLHEIFDEVVPTNSGALMQWKDITYVNMPENYVCVIQEGDKQLVLGSGRYLLRAPTTLFGQVDVQQLSNKMFCEAMTESAGAPVNGVMQDEVTKVRLEAGEWQKVGAITFIRAQPGFCWVVQNSQGDLRTGIGFCVARGGEVFKRFVDYQNYARTTRPFLLESKDRQEVRVRVQLRWRLVDAKTWVLRQGASEDIFDAIEEIAQAMLRDAIAANTYEDCMKQAKEGYDGIENNVRPRLAEETQLLGGFLLGFEVRELRFPRLDSRNIHRAQQEAKLSEELLEQKRRLEIEAQENARKDALRVYENNMTKLQIEHTTNMELLKEKHEVAKTMSAATVKKAQSDADIMLKTVQLKAENETQILKLKYDEEKQKSVQNVRMLEFKQTIDEQALRQTNASEITISAAKAEADALLSKSQADAQSRLVLAEAESKSADLMGISYSKNAEYVKFKLAEMHSTVAKERALAMSTAMANNKSAMMSPDLQRELAVLDAGFSPIAPIVLGGIVGGGIPGKALRE